MDSERVRLVYRTGSLPHFAFPAEDVRLPAERRAGGHRVRHRALGDGGAWLEEDDEIIVHPRDPYHRIDVLNTSRHIVVRVDGEEVARSEGTTRILFETALPQRYYLPRDHVRMECAVALARPHRLRIQGVRGAFRPRLRPGSRVVLPRAEARGRARARPGVLLPGATRGGARDRRRGPCPAPDALVTGGLDLALSRLVGGLRRRRPRPPTRSARCRASGRSRGSRSTTLTTVIVSFIPTLKARSVERATPTSRNA